MTTYSAIIHLQEKYDHPVYGPIFDGWVDSEVECVFDNARCAMTSDQATGYVAAQEKRAQRWSQAYTTVADGSLHPTKTHANGTPCFDTISTEIERS